MIGYPWKTCRKSVEWRGSDSQKSGFFIKKKKKRYVGQKGKFLERRVIPRKNVEKIVKQQ